MEAAGLALACASLGETTLKLFKLTKRLRNAPKDWERYRALLENFRQLLEAVNGLAAINDGLDKVVVQRDGRKCGLIEFCMANTLVTLNDATRFVNEYKSIEKHGFEKLKEFLRRKGDVLKFVIRDEDVAACIRHVETAMVGLSIAMHAASLARTNDGFNENQLAIGELTTQLSDALAKIDRRHEESIKRGKQTAVRFVVQPQRRRFQRFLGKPERQHQSIQVPEVSSSVDAGIPIPELRAIETPNVRSGAVLLRNHSKTQQKPTRETLTQNAEALGLMASTSGMEVALLSSHDDENDVEIICEDGSVALIPAKARLGCRDEGVDGAAASFRIPPELSLVHLPPEKTAPISDAQRLLQLWESDQTETKAVDDDMDPQMTLRRLQSFFQFSFKLSRHDEDDESLDTTNLRYLCVDNLVPYVHGKIDFSRLRTQEPCDQFPLCEHIKIDQLDGGKSIKELLQSTMGHVILVSDNEGLEPAHYVSLFSQIDSSAYRNRCGGVCDHSQMEDEHSGEESEEETATAQCMRQMWLFVMICRTEGTTDDSDDEEESNSSDPMGPFRSVPCLFCRAAALSPQMEVTEESDSLVSYGKHSYGYKCERCQKVSWITGVEQAGFGQAGTARITSPQLPIRSMVQYMAQSFFGIPF